MSRPIHTAARLLIGMAALPVAPAIAAVAAPAIPIKNYANSISGGVSAGVVSGRDAYFRGWAIEYGRRFAPRWSLGLGMAWDRETEQFSSKPDKKIETYTAHGTVSYALTERFGLTTGLGVGIADDDNPAGSIELTNGDISTALIGTFSTDGLPLFTQDSINVSLSLEYNISQREPSASIDLFFGWSY